MIIMVGLTSILLAASIGAKRCLTYLSSLCLFSYGNILITTYILGSFASANNRIAYALLQGGILVATLAVWFARGRPSLVPTCNLEGLAKSRWNVMLFLGVVALYLVNLYILITTPQNIDDVVESYFTIEETIEELLEDFDPQRPGYGITDYGTDEPADIAKSYAFMLMAELQREQLGLFPEYPSMAETAGVWLLDNAYLSEQGYTGWGVSLSWDPYNDGSPNPKNAVYTISNAIAIDALLDWIDNDPNAPQELILTILVEVTAPYLDEKMRSPSGLFPYSLYPQDRPYDTFNPAVYLAGEFQRLATYVDEPVATQLRASADETMLATLDNSQLTDQGHWYWHYSLQEPIPNDIAHASYIVHGIRTYVAYDGQYASAFDLQAVIAHLTDFYDDSKRGKLHGWPIFRQDVDDDARLYDLGMLQYMSCTEPALISQRDELLTYVSRYKRDSGEYLKFPIDSMCEVNRETVSGNNMDCANNPEVNEYKAYLYRGLLTCLQSRNVFDVSENKWQTIPFVSPHHQNPNIQAEYNIRQRQIRLIDQNQTLPNTTSTALPISIHTTQTGSEWQIHRRFPRQELYLTHNTNTEQSQLLVQHGDKPETHVDLIYRGSGLIGEDLVVVYYHNPSLQNYVVRYTLQNDNIIPLGTPYPLPPLENPAGRTYEMIPGIFVLPHDTEIHIVGGRRYVQWTEQAGWTSQHLPQCEKTIEAVMGARHPIILCLPETFTEPEFLVVDFAEETTTKIPLLDGIPYNMGFDTETGNVTFSYARTPEDVLSMAIYDIERLTQTGWLDYAINNTEGRIPWSQIYYLNGFLDILYLAERDPQMQETFAPLLPQIRQRLDLEISILDQIWLSNSYKTRAFTVDRSEAIFAVQTARLLLLMDRYQREVADPLPLLAYYDLRESVRNLTNHIEVVAYQGESETWLTEGRAHLRWPYGSAFYFDGLNVPYNHQNEWAYAVVVTRRTDNPEDDPVLADALDILSYFREQIAPEYTLPADGIWPYWWGTAYDGWSVRDRISVNTPKYVGDKGVGWISFRTIDAMASLSAPHLLELDPTQVTTFIDSAEFLVENGALYPFSSYALYELDRCPQLDPIVALRYSRVSSQWELQNAAWAWYALVQQNPVCN